MLYVRLNCGVGKHERLLSSEFVRARRNAARGL
jgi:hypothetical protein